MRMSVSIHPPSRGDSLEWRLRRVYRDGFGKTSSVVLDDYELAQDAAQTALDEPGVLEVHIEGRPAVEFRSTKGHDVDGWRVDARYSLDVESSGSLFSVVSLDDLRRGGESS